MSVIENFTNRLQNRITGHQNEMSGTQNRMSVIENFTNRLQNTLSGVQNEMLTTLQ